MSIDLTVFNLPLTVTPEQLQEAFAAYGQVEQASVADRGKQAHGYVRMADEQQAHTAMLGLDGVEVERATIRVGEGSEDTKITLSNLPQRSNAGRVKALLAQFGEVMYILHFKRTASVRMQTVSAAASALESHFEMDGNTIGVYPLGARQQTRLTPEQEQAARSIADELGETGPLQVRALKEIVRLCGLNFTQAVLEETRHIEVSGGLMTAKGDRRRTSGGVFFYLARQRLPGTTWRRIFPQQYREVSSQPGAKGEPVTDKPPITPKAHAQDDPKASAQGVPKQASAKTQPTSKVPQQPAASRTDKPSQDGRTPIPRDASPTGTQARGTKKKAPATSASSTVQPTSSGADPSAFLAQLREAEQAAREKVATIRASAGQVGLAKAISDLQTIKKDIVALLKANPDLA